MNASHSPLVIFISLCDSYMERPVYFCGASGDPADHFRDEVLNPGGGTRWCLIDAGIRVQSRVDHNAINKIIDDDGNGVDATEALVKCWGSGISNYRRRLPLIFHYPLR